MESGRKRRTGSGDPSLEFSSRAANFFSKYNWLGFTELLPETSEIQPHIKNNQLNQFACVHQDAKRSGLTPFHSGPSCCKHGPALFAGNGDEDDGTENQPLPGTIKHARRRRCGIED